MADESNKQAAPTIQDRQKAVVAQIQAVLVALPRFRPTDVVLAPRGLSLVLVSDTWS